MRQRTRQQSTHTSWRFHLVRLFHALSVVACLLLLFLTSGRVLKAGVTGGSLSGVRAAPFSYYGAGNDRGMVARSIESIVDGDTPGETLHQTLHQNGVGWVRYWLSWDWVEHSNGGYDWSVPDHDIQAAIDQGLNVYVTIQSAPAWAHGGVNTYVWGNCALIVNGVPTGAFDPTRPGCGQADYAPFDPGMGNGQSFFWKRFVTAAVKRYGDRVKYWGFWNEPSSGWFWPPYNEAPCNSVAGQLIAKVIKPARDAALAANSSVVIVGPDETQFDQTSNTAPWLDVLLSIERNGAPNCGVPAGRLWDVISWHAYAGNSGQNIPVSLNAVKHTLDNYDRREVWITETDADGTGLNSVLDEFAGRGWISKVFVHGTRGVCGGGALIDQGTLTACPSLYSTYHNYIAAHPPAMHFAGTTGVSGHWDFLLLENPHGTATTANVSYATPWGAVQTRSYALAASSRATIFVPNEFWPGWDQGVTVTPADPTMPIWAEHADYTQNTLEAGRSAEGAYERSDTWYFAEGAWGGGWWTEYVTAYNPNDTQVNVTYTFVNQNQVNSQQTYPVGGHGLIKLPINASNIDQNHSTIVSGVWADGGAHNGQPAPIAADRTMSWNNDIDWHESKGVPFPSTNWYFAEGNVGGGWSTYLLLMNPADPNVTPNRTANLYVYYMLPSGLSSPTLVQVGAGRRVTVNPADVGIGGSFGIIVQSLGPDTVPVVAERAMYYGSDWTVGTMGQGATSPMQRWRFAEGSTYGYYPYYLLANPSSLTVTVQATFYLEGASPVSFSVPIGPGQRYTIDPSSIPSLQNHNFAAEFTVLKTGTDAPPGIVAERAMYWLGGAPWRGGHVSLGMP
jgi:hypothetical protein